MQRGRWSKEDVKSNGDERCCGQTIQGLWRVCDRLHVRRAGTNILHQHFIFQSNRFEIKIWGLELKQQTSLVTTVECLEAQTGRSSSWTSFCVGTSKLGLIVLFETSKWFRSEPNPCQNSDNRGIQSQSTFTASVTYQATAKNHGEKDFFS